MDAFQVAQYIVQFANNEEVKAHLKQFGIGIVPNSLSELISKLEGAGYIVMKKEDFEREYSHTSLIEQAIAGMEFQHNELMSQLAQQQTSVQNPTQNNGFFNPNWQQPQQVLEPQTVVQNGTPNFESFSPLKVLEETIKEGEDEISKQKAEEAKANEKKQLVDPFSDNNLVIIDGANKEVNFKDFGKLPPVEEGIPFQNTKQSKDPFAQSPFTNTQTFGTQNQTNPETQYQSQLPQPKENLEFKHVSPEIPATNEIEEMWKEFLEKATQKEPISFMSLILNAKPISFENNILALTYASTQTYQMKQIKNKQDQLIALFEKEMGKTVQFTFELSEKE